MFHFSNLVTKVKGLSKSTLLILGTAITSLTLAVTSIGVGFGIQNARATTIIDENNVQALFPTANSVNEDLARSLLTLAAAAQRSSTMPTSGTPFVMPNGVKFATARDVAASNTGSRTSNAPVVRLFKTLYTGSVAANELADLSWRLVGITYPGDVTAMPTFTFVATAAYRVSAFGPNADYNDASCTIRNNIFQDFGIVAAEYSSKIVSSIVPPSALPYRWQENEPTGYQFTSRLGGGSQYTKTVANDSLANGSENCPIWIPSVSEIRPDAYGIFNLIDSEEFSPKIKGGNSAYSRSRCPDFWAGDSTWDYDYKFGGLYFTENGMYSGERGVLPAVHISGQVLKTLLPDYVSGDDGDDGEEPVPGTPDKPIVHNYVDQSQKGLSPGALGGIIGGALVAVGGATCGIIYYISRRQRKDLANS